MTLGAETLQPLWWRRTCGSLLKYGRTCAAAATACIAPQHYQHCMHYDHAALPVLSSAPKPAMPGGLHTAEQNTQHPASPGKVVHMEAHEGIPLLACTSSSRAAWARPCMYSVCCRCPRAAPSATICNLTACCCDLQTQCTAGRMERSLVHCTAASDELPPQESRVNG